MTDHLPECPWPEKPCGPDHEPMHDRQPLFCVACLTECICDELRACEQRVREEDQRSLIKYGVQMFMRGKQYGRPMTYAAGVQAAREAVAALDIGRKVRLADTLAAIDALRGER